MNEALRRDFGLKLLAVVLASLAWLYAHGEQTNEATFVTPVEILLPPDLVLMNDDPLPERVVIVASGTRAALARVQEVNLRYLVDLEASVAGTTEYSFRTPPPGWPGQLRISTVSPAMIRFRFDEQTRRSVPVQLRTRGELPPGFLETAREFTPADVTLVGARSDLADLELIRTTPVDLKTATAGFDRDIALDTQGLHLLDESPTSVRVRLQVEEVIAQREYGDVTVRPSALLADRQDLELLPASLVVRLEGPVPVLDSLRAEGLVIELVGDPANLPAPGAKPIVLRRVDDEEALGLRVRIDHPRGDRLKVLSLTPNSVKLSVHEPSEPDDGEEGKP